MLRIIKHIVLLFVSIYFCAFPIEIYAQDDPKVKTISKKVGHVIDENERIEYALFEEYAANFKEAQFYEYPDKRRILIITLKDETKVEKELSEVEFYEFKTQINKRKIDYLAIDSSYNCIIKLMDETSISGRIIEVLEKEIVVKNEIIDEIKVSKSKIAKITILHNDVKKANQFWIPNPHDSRHYFAPTARNMSKGEFYFQDVYLVVASLNYAFTKYLTVGGGMSIIPGIGFNQQVYFLNPKVGFEVSEKFHLGGGLLYANIPEQDEEEIKETITIPVVFEGQTIGDTTIDYTIDWKTNIIRHHGGILFGVGTYGNRENNFTAGVGMAYIDDVIHERPVIMLGGMFRMTSRTSFVTENWFITTYHEKDYADDHPTGYYTTGVISYGIRFFGEKMCVDMAFFQVPGKLGIGEFIFPGIPYLDFVYKF